MEENNFIKLSLLGNQWNKHLPLTMILLIVFCGIIGFLLSAMPIRFSVAMTLGVPILAFSMAKTKYYFYVFVFMLILISSSDSPAPSSIFNYLVDYNTKGMPSVLELGVTLLLFSFIVRWILHKERVAFSPFNFYVIIYLLLFLISFWIGFQNGADSIFLKEDFKRFLLPVLFFICSLNILNSDRNILVLAIVSYIAAVIKSSLGIIYYLKGYGFPYGDMKVIFLSSGDFLPFITVILVTLSLIIHKKVRFSRLILLVLGICPMLFALIFSFRRNTWVGLLFSLIILFILIPGVRKVKMAMLVLFMGLSAFTFVSLKNVVKTLPSANYLSNRVYSIVDKKQDSNVAHMREWEITFADIMRNPILGLGLGSEHSTVPGYEGLNRHTVHNAYLMLWMKMGLFALLLFLWCLIRYFILGVRAAKTKVEHSLKPLQIGLFSTFGFWVVSFNVGATWFYYQESMLMALVASIVIVLSIQKTSSLKRLI